MFGGTAAKAAANVRKGNALERTAAPAADVANIGGNISTRLGQIGVLGSGAAQQMSEFVNEYTAKRAETGEAIDVGTLNEIGMASMLIGALEAVLPGRFLNSRYMDRATKAFRDNPGVIKYGLTGLVTEGATEGAQKVIYNAVIRDTLIDEDRALLEGVIREGGVGGTAGMILGMIAGAIAPKKLRGRGAEELGNTGEGSRQNDQIQQELAGLADPNGSKYSLLDGKSETAVPQATGDPLTDIYKGVKESEQVDRPSRRSESVILEGNDEPTLQLYGTLTEEQQEQVRVLINTERAGYESGTRGSVLLGKLHDMLTAGSTAASQNDMQVMIPRLSSAIAAVTNPQATSTATAAPSNATPSVITEGVEPPAPVVPAAPEGQPVQDLADVFIWRRVSSQIREHLR